MTPSRVTVLIVWSAMTFSVAIYGFLAFTIAQGRAGRREMPLTDYLAGSLAFLPYVLPLILLALGWQLYSRIALRGSGSGGGDEARWGEQTRPTWSRIQTGLIVMLAVFEINAIVGLVFFFLGSPLEKFWIFAAGTLLLNALALQRLIATWPRD